MSIIVSTVAGDEPVDEVSLVDGKLVFTTGGAEDLFMSKVQNGIPAAAVYEFYSDWSNGYLVAKASGDD
jgi:hypothetical protein